MLIIIIVIIVIIQRQELYNYICMWTPKTFFQMS